MSRRAFSLILTLSCLILAASVFAQEGHPLSGTWSGDYGLNATQRTHLTLVMSWDGKTVTGTINPGENAIQIPSIALDVTNWTVRFEVDTKDSQGRVVHAAFEGKIEDLSSAHRKIMGTYTTGNSKGDLKLTRD